MTTAFHAAVCHRLSPRHRRHSEDLLLPYATVTLFLKPNTNTSATFSPGESLSHFSPSAIFAASVAASTSQFVSFELLEELLSARNYRLADEETRRLLIVLAGDAAVKRGYVFFSEVQFISEEDLREIDRLWALYSDNKFGYRAQKQIWEKCNRDFTKFFIKVGWMKKLEGSEVEQYTYRAFPAEFMWELEPAATTTAPDGHLPLTNALRGIQLLSNILSHPAFQEEEVDIAAGEEERKVLESPITRSFKPNYTF